MGNRRTGARRRRLAVSLSLLAVSACADSGATGTAGSDETRRLFTRAYDEVMELYIEPVTARDVALPALARLSAVDPDLAVTEADGDIVLGNKGIAIERLVQPAARDARSWGKLTAAFLMAAKRRSPQVAAVPEDELDRTLFSGLTGALDRFSRYLTPRGARDEAASREGFGGIGITLDYANQAVHVSAIMADSPAEHAGIEVGDQIIDIDGSPTSTLSRQEIVRRLRGLAGSRVEITLTRASEALPLHKALTREYLVVPTVTASRDGVLAIFKIAGFNEHTTDALREEFVKLRQEVEGGLRGVILDLRGNPGGLLDQAASVADLFMWSGRIVATVGRNPSSNQEFDVKHGDITDGLPIVVLMNGGSASSAEIVAAALQDSGRAVVVGSASYGKGTVQIVERLPNEGELILTVARVVTPAGYVLHEHGVVPNVCTDGAAEGAAGLAAIISRANSLDISTETPRATLDEAGWAQLRDTCPGESRDRRIDVETAEGLLANTALYGHLLHGAPPSIAASSPLARAAR